MQVKITPNYCDYIAIPMDNEKVIFYPQPKHMKGKRYERDFSFMDKDKFHDRGNFQNQNDRRWAKDFYELPN